MNKIVIVVLILIVVIFVIFVARGSLTADQPKRGNRQEAAEFSKQKKAPGWSKTIKNLLGGLGGKLELPCEKKAAPDKNIQCEKMPLNTEIKIPAETGASFRTATFVLLAGKARIEYDDETAEAEDLELEEQDFDLPNFETEDPRIGSIVALEKGGKLEISCSGNQSCQVGLQ